MTKTDIVLFIYVWLLRFFFAGHWLSLVVASRGALHCDHCDARALGNGLSNCGTRASFPVAYGIFLNQGSNPYALH